MDDSSQEPSSEQQDSDSQKLAELNDPERNLRAFANARAAMGKMRSVVFGTHSGAIVTQGEFGPRGSESGVPEPDLSDVEEVVKEASKPIYVAIDQHPSEARSEQSPDIPQPAAKVPANQIPVDKSESTETAFGQTSVTVAPNTSGYRLETAGSANPLSMPDYGDRNGTDVAMPELDANASRATSEASVDKGIDFTANRKGDFDGTIPSLLDAKADAPKKIGGVPFLRSMSQPQRPIMEDANPKEQNADQWLNSHNREYVNPLDPGGATGERKVSHSERGHQREMVAIGDTVDEFAIHVGLFATRVVGALNELSRRLARLEQSIDSEGSNYE